MNYLFFLEKEFAYDFCINFLRNLKDLPETSLKGGCLLAIYTQRGSTL